MQDPQAITNSAQSQSSSSTSTADTPEGAEPPLSPEGYRTAPDQVTTGWPSGIPYIVGNEACERFSYYGMRAILYLHLTSLYAALSWVQDEAQAKSLATSGYHLFMAGVYAFPMIGALISDRLGGKYRTILYLSLVYCMGHAVLSAGENVLTWVFLGLALIALGSGGIKPCVSANVGDQFGKGNWHLLPTIYQIFYFSINFGSFFATLLIPLTQNRAGGWLIRNYPDTFVGWDPHRLGTSIAFGIPGVLMFIATVIFWMGRRQFVHVPAKPGGRLGLLDTLSSVSLFLAAGHLFGTPQMLPASIAEEPMLKWLVLSGISAVFLVVGVVLFNARQRIQEDDGFLAVTLYVIKSHLGMVPRPTGAPMKGEWASSWFWKPAVHHFGEKVTEGPVAVVKVVSVLAFLLFFWALFDQHSSTWIEQAGMMDLRLFGNQESFLGIPGVQLTASQSAAANPLLVMLLIPLMNWAYRRLDRAGWQTTQLRRMTVGMYLTALSFVATAVLQQYIDAEKAAGRPNSVWIGWQQVQYVIITVAEILVSITMLEFAYTQAPKKMKSTIMGFAMLTITLGNVLVAMLAGVQKGMTRWVSENVVPGMSELATFFWIFAVLCAVAAVLFGVRAWFYVPKDYAQE